MRLLKLVCRTRCLAEEAKMKFSLIGYDSVIAGSAVITNCPPNGLFAQIQCNVKAYTQQVTDYDRGIFHEQI